MATILIEGKKVSVPDGLSDEELQSVVSSMDTPQPKESLLHKAASLAYTPFRGYRAIGAGLATGDMQEAGSATKPGYKPSSLRASIGAGIGEAIPTIAATGGAGVLGGAAAGGVTAAVGKLAEDKKSTVGSAVKHGVISGLMDLVVGGTLKSAATFGKGLIRSALSAAKGTPIATTERVLENAALRPSVKGTTESVEKAANEVRDVVAKGRTELGKKVGEARVAMGLKPKRETIEKRILEGGAGLHPLDKTLKDANATIEVLSQRKEVYPMYADWLDELKQSLRAHMKFSQKSADPRFVLNAQEQALLAEKVNQIEALTARIKGGENLQKANAEFSEFMEDLGPLATKLQTTGDTIELFRSVGKAGEKAGKTAETAERVANVVGKKEAKKVSKLLNEIALNEYLNPSKYGYANPLRSGFLGLAGKAIEAPEAIIGKRAGLATTRLVERTLESTPFIGLTAGRVARRLGILPGIDKE